MAEQKREGSVDLAGLLAAGADHSARNTGVLVVFTVLTNLADGITKVVLPLMATAMTRSPALVSGVLLTLTLPWLFAALPVGVLVDHADRRTLLWLANGLRTTVVLTLLAAVASHRLALPILYGGGTLLGIAEVIALTAATAIVPAAVAPPGRERANTWLSATETLCNEFAGPPTGGLLAAVSTTIALGSTASAYTVATVILILLVGRFRVKRAAGAPKQSVRHQAAEGVRFLWRQPLLRVQALTAAVLNTCWSAWVALMPLVATRTMGLTASQYGALVGALGVGGLVGTVTMRSANRVLGRRRVMLANIFLTGIMVAAPAATTNAWAVGAAALVGGVGGGLWTVNARTIGQTLVDTEMMGRYSAASRLIGWGSLPLGAAAAGALAQGLGAKTTFAIFAATTVIAILPFRRAFTPQAISDLEDRIATPGPGHRKPSRTDGPVRSRALFRNRW